MPVSCPLPFSPHRYSLSSPMVVCKFFSWFVRQKSNHLAFHAPEIRPPGVWTPTCLTLTEATVRQQNQIRFVYTNTRVCIWRCKRYFTAREDYVPLNTFRGKLDILNTNNNRQPATKKFQQEHLLHATFSFGLLTPKAWSMPWLCVHEVWSCWTQNNSKFRTIPRKPKLASDGKRHDNIGHSTLRHKTGVQQICNKYTTRRTSGVWALSLVQRCLQAICYAIGASFA